ncbi:MAG: orotate phosphoribosyltransferase [bacterium]
MNLTSADILQIFKDTGALMNGHFKLTSGLHSDTYFQCAKVLQYPRQAEKICALIADHFKNSGIQAVASPAIGGIVIGYEVARLMQVRSIFTERKNEDMTLRRGFRVNKGEKILIVEDVTTTGGSVKEVIEVMKDKEAEISGVASMVDRSGGKATFTVPFFSTFQMQVTNYSPENCPLCKKGIPVTKPGSRK